MTKEFKEQIDDIMEMTCILKGKKDKDKLEAFINAVLVSVYAQARLDELKEHLPCK